MPEKIKFHSLSAIITFILLPPFWCLSVPALLFSSEAKKLAKLGAVTLAEKYAEKAGKFIVSAWLIFLILVLSALVLFLLVKMSLL